VILRETESFGDQTGAAIIRNEIGRVYAAQGWYDKALDYYRQALAVLETSNEKRVVAMTLVNMSDAYLAEGKFAEAAPIAERAVSLARQMSESGDLSAMPILADALQDAGCDNEDILSHCRDIAQVHVRGCWACDLVLGKA